MKKSIFCLVFSLCACILSVPAQAQLGGFLKDLKDNVDSIKDASDSMKGLVDSVKGNSAPSSTPVSAQQQNQAPRQNPSPPQTQQLKITQATPGIISGIPPEFHGVWAQHTCKQMNRITITQDRIVDNDKSFPSNTKVTETRWIEPGRILNMNGRKDPQLGDTWTLINKNKYEVDGSDDQIGYVRCEGSKSVGSNVESKAQVQSNSDLLMAQQCAPNEKTLFAGSTGKKMALICALPNKVPFTQIEYRFGMPGQKVELNFLATSSNKNKFYAGIEEEGNTSYTGLRFKNGTTTYTAIQCGGSFNRCEHSGGILITNGAKIIAKIKMTALKDMDYNLLNISDVIGFSPNGSGTPFIQFFDPTDKGDVYLSRLF